MAGVRREQIELGQKLFQALLEDFATLLEKGEATAADRATLARLLTQNGYSINPADLPDELRTKITTEFDPEADLDDEFGALKVV